MVKYDATLYELGDFDEIVSIYKRFIYWSRIDWFFIEPHFLHVVLAEGAVSAGPSGYYFYEQYLVNDYNRIYVRFFESSDLQTQEVQLSYWGLTTSRPLTGNPNKPVNIYLNNQSFRNENLFGSHFEVIPEPPSFSLLIFGFLFLKYSRKR